MPRPRMRPSFQVESGCSRETFHDAIRKRLDDESEEVVGKLTIRQCTLEVVPRRQRFWTPSLDLMIEGDSDAPTPRTRVWGTFSPRAEIWTAFVFTLGTLLIASFFASMVGFAQMALGRTPTLLAVPVVALAIGAVLYVAALVGQGLSIAEMYRLRAFVDDCLRDAETAARRAAPTARLSAEL